MPDVLTLQFSLEVEDEATANDALASLLILVRSVRGKEHHRVGWRRPRNPRCMERR